jgi:hypothetical protein
LEQKSLTLEHDDYPFKLQFLDLKSFIAEGDLDTYAIKFARIQEKQKGVFPYEFLKDSTFVEELNKQDLFQYEDFNSTLKEKNISEEEYNTYKELSKNMNRFKVIFGNGLVSSSTFTTSITCTSSSPVTTPIIFLLDSSLLMLTGSILSTSFNQLTKLEMFITK